MNNRLCTFGLLIFLFSSLLLYPVDLFAAEKPTYGDDFLSWVRDKTNERSKEIAEADFNVRSYNYRLLSIEKILKNNNITFESLKEISYQIEEFEKNNVAIDDIAFAVVRQKKANKHLAELIDIWADLESSSSLIDNISRPLSFREFITVGLGSIGRELMLASIIGLYERSQYLADQFSPSISVSYSMDGSGEIRSSMYSRLTDSEFERAIDGVAAMWAGVSNPYALTYLYVKTMLVMHIEMQRIKAQNEKMHEALNLLPSQLLSYKQLYEIYKKYDLKAINEFQTTFVETKKWIEETKETVKQLIRYSLARSEHSNKTLTVSKIEWIANNYKVNSSLKDIIDERALINTAKEIKKYNKNMYQREYSTLNSCGNIQGMMIAEDFLDTLYESKEIYNTLLKKSELAPLHSPIKRTLSYINMILPNNYEIVEKMATIDCKSSEKINSLDLDSSKMIVNEVERDLTLFQNELIVKDKKISHLKSRNVKKSNFSMLGGCLIHRNNDTYECSSDGAGISFGSLFPNNGMNPVFDGLGSLGDGGFRPKSFSLEEDINKADSLIHLRTMELLDESRKIRGIIPQWKKENNEFLLKQNNNSFEQKMFTKRNFEQYLKSNSNYLNGLDERLNNILTSPSSFDDITAIIDDFGGADGRLGNLREDRVMPDNPQITGITSSRKVYGDKDILQRKIARESAKSKLSKKKTILRFQNNQESGVADPVFKNKKDIESLHDICLIDLVYAKEFADPAIDVRNKLGENVTDWIAKEYLKRAQSARMYSAGLTDSIEPEFIDGIGWVINKKVLISEMKSFLSCANNNNDLSDLACNRFVQKTLEEIFKITDFKTDGTSTLNANEMISIVQESDKWKEIGAASIQSNLDKAGLLSAQGKAVIATWFNPEPGENNHGHIAIVHPGRPSGRSGLKKWSHLRLPQVANFALGDIKYSKIDIKITYAFGTKDPAQVIIYARDYE